MGSGGTKLPHRQLRGIKRGDKNLRKVRASE